LNAREAGIDVYPVWNKSNREHTIIKSQPGDVRAEADAAVAALCFKGAYYVDADHIGLKTVDAFIPASDFFTIDVADFTGKAAEADAVEAFLNAVRRNTGSLSIPGIDRPFDLNEKTVRGAAGKFLLAVQEAGRIYRYVAERKGREGFVTEISVDETDAPQSPVELFLILAMIAEERIPVQTIAPKFTGRFNKGVDYVGDLAQFEKEFDEDLSVIAFAILEFGLADTLKLSVHSGSDKFSIYPIINRLIKKHNAGLHVKTAGTNWLEEVIGLAESGDEGLALVKEIYAQAREHYAELVAPYSTVIDINPNKLPDPKSVMGWSSSQYADALRHVESSPHYDPNFRQLLHVGFKVAAGMGKRFTGALEANEEIVARNVTENLFERHLRPIFA
jgi:tagaturonate epimerase